MKKLAGGKGKDDDTIVEDECTKMKRSTYEQTNEHPHVVFTTLKHTDPRKDHLRAVIETNMIEAWCAQGSRSPVLQPPWRVGVVPPTRLHTVSHGVF
jgi:hypothetical protein